MSKCLLIALCLTMLCACSTPQSEGPMPPRPGNLVANCPDLPTVPVPFIDPARLEWEAMIVALYGECAAKVAAAK